MKKSTTAAGIAICPHCSHKRTATALFGMSPVTKGKYAIICTECKGVFHLKISSSGGTIQCRTTVR